jgi:hypothetical protein
MEHPLAHQRDHDMCKILANALALPKRVVNRRVDACALRRVRQRFVQPLRKLA